MSVFKEVQLKEGVSPFIKILDSKTSSNILHLCLSKIIFTFSNRSYVVFNENIFFSIISWLIISFRTSLVLSP